MPAKVKRRNKWELWFALPHFTLIRGRDFKVSIAGMVQQVRNMARMYGKKVHVTTGQATIKVEVEHA